MSSLKNSQKVLSGLKFIGNFLQRPLKVGDIVLNDDCQHLIWGNIEDAVDGFSLKGKTVTSKKVDVKYTKESNVSVNIGISANSTPAKGEVELKFNSKNSAFVSLKQFSRTSVKLGLVDEALKSYWKEKGFDKGRNRNKYHFIAEVISAGSGTVIFSSEKNNSVVLKGKNNTPLTSIAVMGNGSVEYVSNSKSTIEIISTEPIQPLYTAVRFRANGNFEIVG